MRLNATEAINYGVSSLILVPFDFNKLENRFDLFILVISDILYAYKGDIVEIGLLELVSEHPDDEKEYFRLLNMCVKYYPEITAIVKTLVGKFLKNDFIITDIKKIGTNILIKVEAYIDIQYSVEDFYLNYV